MSRSTLTALSAAALLTSGVFAGPDESRAVPELGVVEWGRDLDAARAMSASTGRPVFLLFQEIPGCKGCVDFGQSVLTHPLVVEAIETEFIPVAIHNNKPGADEIVLKQYKEPAWNFPVARFVDADGADLIPRKERIFETGNIAQRMILALEAAKRPVPEYLRLTALELAPKNAQSAVFSMHCFWEGEADLGGLDGVLDAKAVWIDGREGVAVKYDATAITMTKLVETADARKCADKVYVGSDEALSQARAVIADRAVLNKSKAKAAKASDHMRTLTRSRYNFLPLTQIQAVRINAALRRNGDPAKYLSSRQRAMAKAVKRALLNDPKSLDGLTPDRTPTGVVAYERALRQRLEKAGTLASAS